MISQELQRLIAITLTLAFVGYAGYSLSQKEPNVTAVQNDFASSETASQDISALSEELQKIQIDASLFSSPLFTSLFDFSTPVIPEEQGRPNPFNKIGTDSIKS